MKQKDLAAALGVGPAVVTRLKARGMPTDSVEAARAWRDSHLTWRRSKGVRVAASSAAPGQTSIVAVPLTGATVWENRARREAAEADLAELKLQELRSSLVRVDDIRAALARRAVAFRESLLHIPARVSAQLAAETEERKVADILNAEIRHALALLFDTPLADGGAA